MRPRDKNRLQSNLYKSRSRSRLKIAPRSESDTK